MSHKGLTSLEKKDITVLYLAGSGRSGSTLIELTLNKALGQPATGELLHIWRDSLYEVKCGCEEVFSECEFWRDVFGEQALSKEFFEEASLLRKTALRWRYLPWMLFPMLAPNQYKTRLKKFINYYEQLYLALASKLQTPIIIDSSKNILMLFLFNKFKKVNFKIVHLVRDPRGVIYSWRFRKKVNLAYYKKKAYMKKISIGRMIVLWWLNYFLVSIQCVRLGTCSTITYDDFVLQPKETVQYLFDSLDVDNYDISVIKNSKIILDDNHTMFGNPMRFKRGELTIRKDNEWKKKMPFWAKWISTLFTFPWFVVEKNMRKAKR